MTGFIDQVLWYPKTQEVGVRDHKFGSTLPVDPLQLQTYALAVGHVLRGRENFDPGIQPIWVDYWHGRKAVATKSRPLHLPDIEPVLTRRVEEVVTALRTDFYPARPSAMACGSCPVRALCPVMKDE
jgi:PD-(D/E)XK nuclease superfamily